MPLPLKALAVIWAAKAIATTKGYKKLKEKKPELVEKWESKAKNASQAVTDKAKQAKDYLFGKKDDNSPPEP